MNKTLADIRKENFEKYYPDKEPTFADFKVGCRVKIITPCEDFYFFYGETGKIIKNDNSYLGIMVKFDIPREFSDGTIQTDFNFNPNSLFIIPNDPDEYRYQVL